MLSELIVQNRMKTLFTSLLLALALLPSLVVAADETRWYDVEVIIFNHKGQQYRDSELWPVDYELPQTEETQTLLSAPSNSSKPVAFSRLDPKSLQLTAEAARIDSAPDMELLLHLGWRQPGLAENKAVAVKIDGESSEQLSGTLKLTLSRYLHINTDLIYREPLSEESLDQQVGTPNVFSPSEEPAALSFEPRFQAYHMKQSRRMRSRELHYLDHPLIGMAILVTPYEEEK